MLKTVTCGWAVAISFCCLPLLSLSRSAGQADDMTPGKTSPKTATDEFTPQQRRFFEAEVRPILTAKCIKCHGGTESVKGGLRLTSRPSVLEGGDDGPAVSLEDPDSSLLLEAINYGGLEMPPQGKLPRDQIEVLERWVKMGLPWSGGALQAVEASEGAGGPPRVDAHTRSFWSFQPVRRPPPPSPRQADWVTNPIDAFVLQRLEAANLQPAPPAGKTALLRRAYYDLIGLPPSPDDVNAFLADDSPDAFAKVVDGLLESKHYGERWGRHWLDLVRYAETNSYERDGAKPYVWRYRDYVIRALNEDKPYDRFLIEQLAGDEMEGGSAESLVATGYYRLGIWDDEPSDPELALYDDLDDIITTTSQVFLGLTINCARCHDHKLDPIPQRDYYQMLAFFSGVTRYGVRSEDSVAKNSLRPIATAEERKRHLEETAAHQQALESTERDIKAIEDQVTGDFEPVEREEFKHERNRAALVQKRVPGLISQETFERYVGLTKRRRELKSQPPAALAEALCVTEVGSHPRDTFVLVRGNPQARADQVHPAFLEILNPQPPQIVPPPSGSSTCGRRLALAHWIAGPENPLTARVMANRLWHYHFGRGIVRSTNNFGLQGDPPTHPELLDWLASELVAGGWRLKRMHRLIMLSSTYRMSSQADPAALRIDPENNLLWRFNMRRLEAEEIRDSILAVNGSLNCELGGPSIFPVIPAEVLAGQSRPGSGWDVSPPVQRTRRSVYIHVKRSLITPMLASFDVADADATCPVRFSTTQPTQALGMLNSQFIHEQAEVLAEYLRQAAGPNVEDQVRLGFRRALQREPTADEVRRGTELVESFGRDNQVDAEQALQYFCLLVLNLNEFIYLD